jgi:LPXTG-motif cell wall-anchored protein
MRRSSSTIIHRLLIGTVAAVVGLILNAPASNAAAVSLKVGDTKAGAGKTVSIPITLESAAGEPGMGALQFALMYDPKVLEPKDVIGGKLAPSALVESKASTPGRLGLSFATNENVTGTGQVLVAHFKVLGKKGDKTEVRVDNAKAWQGDLDLFDIKVDAKPGTFTVSGSSFPWWIIAVAVGVLLLLLLLLWRRRRKKKAAAASAPPPVAAPA